MGRFVGASLCGGVVLAVTAGNAWAAAVPLVGERTLVRPRGDVPPRLFEEPARLNGRAADGREMEVPLVHTDVEMDIRGLVASTTVTQQYVNRSDTPLETVYRFPLPHGAAVYDMEIRIGDRVIRSTVQPREQAQKTYEEARQNGQRAALLTQERPNIFTTAIANVLPGDALDIRIRYVEKLAWDHGNIRVTFPTVVAPRFIPGPVQDPLTGLDAPVVPDARSLFVGFAPVGRSAGHDLSFRAVIDLGSVVPDVTSPTHVLAVQSADARRVDVQLEDVYVLPDRDVVLDLRAPARTVPTTSLFLSPSRDGNGSEFMLVAYPPTEKAGDSRAPIEWLFLVDVSGSMEGPSITQAREAVLQAFPRMRSGDRFNIVAYDNTYRSFREAPVPRTGAGVDDGEKFVKDLRASGGTMMLPALQHVMGMPATEGALRYIVLLTDGELGNEEEIFTAMRRQLGGARLFVVTVGSAPNHFLAAKMAQFGRGSTVQIADGREIAAQMKTLLDRIESPVMSELSLHWQGVTAQDVQPERMPDLFLGSPLVVLGRIGNSSGRLTLRSMRDGKPETWTTNVDVRGATSHPGISTLWARQKLESLMDTWRGSRNDEEREARRLSVVHTAMAYNLVSAFTSLVAVEDKVVNENGVQKKVTVPVEVPAGMSRENIESSNPHGGTMDDFLELMALVLLLCGAAVLAIQGRTWARA